MREVPRARASFTAAARSAASRAVACSRASIAPRPPIASAPAPHMRTAAAALAKRAASIEGGALR